MQNIKWLRVIGDSIFAVGIISIGWFVLKSQFRGPASPRDEEHIELKPRQRLSAGRKDPALVN